MKEAEERGAPGFSKEYINRQQRIRSENFIHSLSFQLMPTHTLPPTPETLRDDPYFYLHVPG